MKDRLSIQTSSNWYTLTVYQQAEIPLFLGKFHLAGLVTDRFIKKYENKMQEKQSGKPCNFSREFSIPLAIGKMEGLG